MVPFFNLNALVFRGGEIGSVHVNSQKVGGALDHSAFLRSELRQPIVPYKYIHARTQFSVDPGHPPPLSYTSSEPISNIFTFLESLVQMIVSGHPFFEFRKLKIPFWAKKQKRTEKKIKYAWYVKKMRIKKTISKICNIYYMIFCIWVKIVTHKKCYNSAFRYVFAFCPKRLTRYNHLS